MTDKEKAEHCSCFLPGGTFRDDKDEPTCMAHLAEARVFSCGVWLGRAHLKRSTPFNLCVDGLLNIPKEILEAN